MKVKTVDEVKEILKNYEEICERAKEISNELAYVREFDINEDTLLLYGSDRGGDSEVDSFPIDWLFKTNGEINEIRLERIMEKERERIEREKERKKEEEKEYEEYLRLKKKYG